MQKKLPLTKSNSHHDFKTKLLCKLGLAGDFLLKASRKDLKIIPYLLVGY